MIFVRRAAGGAPVGESRRTDRDTGSERPVPGEGESPPGFADLGDGRPGLMDRLAPNIYHIAFQFLPSSLRKKVGIVVTEKNLICFLHLSYNSSIISLKRFLFPSPPSRQRKRIPFRCGKPSVRAGKLPIKYSRGKNFSESSGISRGYWRKFFSGKITGALPEDRNFPLRRTCLSPRNWLSPIRTDNFVLI